MFLSFLCFFRGNFSDFYQNKDNYYPSLIFPHYPGMETSVSVFNDFAEKSDEVFFFSLDCLQHRTYCMKLSLKPGFLHIYDNITKENYPIVKEISEESIKYAIKIAYIRNVHVLVNKEQVLSLSSKAPLFLLVARPNAGDLETKRPIFNELAMRYIGKNVSFGFVTDANLYEQFSHYPLTALVCVSPSLKHLSYRGLFNIEEIKVFVDSNLHHVWDYPKSINAPALTIVGNSKYFYKVSNEYADYETQFPMAYVNSTSNGLLARSICGPSCQCTAIVDYGHYSAYIINEDILPASVQDLFINFRYFVAQQGFIHRIYVYANIAYSLHQTNFIVVGILCGVFVVCAILIYNDFKIAV